MRTFAKILLSITCIVACLAWVSITFLPWKGFVEDKAQSFLETKGFQGARFTLSDLGLHEMTLHNITDSGLSLKTLTVSYSLLDFLQGKQPELTANGLSLSMHSDDHKINASVASGNIYAKAIQMDHWRGKWRLNNIQVKFGESALPTLEGRGTLQTLADAFSISGRFKSKDNTHRTIFNFHIPSNNLKLLYATIPWKSGTLTVKNVLIPLEGNQPVKLVLQVRKVSIGALMQVLTGERVSATGSVSGDLPLVIGRDGTVSFGKGKLKANAPGTITMPVDAIPGDNAQIALTRDILKNFHYKTLSISISSGADGEVPILVALEGNNPDMYNGRPIKINVRLSGDVLDFVRQNVMFLTDPKLMLKQGSK